MIASILGLLSQLPQIAQAAVAILGALGAFFAALLVLCKLIPGDQPDLFVESLVQGIANLAKKLGQ
jgi:hypothetical protein